MATPVILGGEKTIKLDYSLLRPIPSEREVESVLDNLGRGNLTLNSISEEVESLEEKFRTYHNMDFAIPFNSCTSALFSAHFASGFSEGDEVIVPSYGYPTGVLSLAYTGAKLIFCDVERSSLSIDPEKLEELINDKTKGIVAINMWGIPGKLDALRKIRDDYGLIMIEDNARGIGGTVSGDKSGTFGDVSCFSFSTGKAISAGEGGMMLTSSEEIYLRSLALGHPGMRYLSDTPYSQFMDTAMGVKHRIHPISVLIANIAFDELERKVEQSNANFTQFSEMFDEFDFIEILGYGSSDYRRGGWSGLAFFYDPSVLGLSVESFTKTLNAEGIRVRKEFESNVLYDLDNFRDSDRLINRKVSFGNGHQYPITEAIRNRLLVSDGLCNYDYPAEEFVGGYRKAIEIVRDNVIKLRRHLEDG
tara:strand:- start:38 stop:1294 length:1257 start_codon:yes stop_codon:yes gene_type:complete